MANSDINIDPPHTPALSDRKAIHHPGLDGIRAFAVALVFLYHFMMRVFPWGWVGVQLFFVLSGFLITGILFASQDAPWRFTKFYVRRALRIFPLYYGILLLWTMIAVVTRGSFPSHFWLWWVYAQNFFYVLAGPSPNDLLRSGGGQAIAAIAHLWSLAVEEQFYFIWPLVVFLVRDRRTLLRVCCVGILLRLGLAAFWQTHLSSATLQAGVTYRMLFTQCDGFLMGGFLALWLRGTPSPVLLRWSGVLGALSVVSYAALLAVVHLIPSLIFGQDAFNFNQGFQATVGLPLANLASAFLLLATLQPGSWAYRLFSLKPLRSLGTVSYGLYFYHLPVYVAIATLVEKFYRVSGFHGRENLWHSIAATILTVVAAYVSFYLLERPFLNLKDSLRFGGSSLNRAPSAALEPITAQPEYTFK